MLRMQKSLADFDRALDQLILSIQVAREAAGMMGPAGISLQAMVNRKRDRGVLLLKRLADRLPKRIKALR
jgi:hypothetical protein